MVKGKSYNPLFRYDHLNKSSETIITVPLLYKEVKLQKRQACQGADHTRTNIYWFLRNANRESASFLGIIYSKWSNDYISHLNKRHYKCKVYNDSRKWDDILDLKELKNIGQNSRLGSKKDWRNLLNEKKEILLKQKFLSVLLVEQIKLNKWPMLKYAKEIISLVNDKQKYLAKLSSLYGLRAIQVEKQIIEWLTNIDMRIYAVETVYRETGNLTPGVDGEKLTKKNMLLQLDYLKSAKLKRHIPSDIKRIFISKGKNFSKSLDIPTIKDRIIQTLFVQVLEPIIDVHADFYSFGYKKGKNAHQAIGELTQTLNTHHEQRRKSKKINFVHPSLYVLNLNIKGFFNNNINHKFLIEHYPIPKPYKSLIEKFLKSNILHQDNFTEEYLIHLPQKSVLGPSMINFALNGLENLILYTQLTKKNVKINKYFSSDFTIKKTWTNKIVRFLNNFIIVTNNKQDATIIYTKVKNFLNIRGLKLDKEKSKSFEWKDLSKFDFLGFTFMHINKPFISKVTKQRDYKGNIKIRSGLYVYPSNKSVIKLKDKIKMIFKNYDYSVYKMIEKLNPVIKKWGDYFSVGTFLRSFSKLDHFIFYRSWRYLKRKYDKISTKKLVEKYYKCNYIKYNRTWQLHGIWNETNSNIKYNRGIKQNWILLLTKLNKPISTQILRARDIELQTSYYLSNKFYSEWCTRVKKARMFKKSNNSWIELYKKQKGLCIICKKPLGYFKKDVLKIHHITPANKKIDNVELTKASNLKLIHKTCYKTNDACF